MRASSRYFSRTKSATRKEHKRKQKETLKREKQNSIQRQRRSLVSLGQWVYIANEDIQLAGKIIDVHKYFVKPKLHNNPEKKTDIIIDVAWSNNPTNTTKHTTVYQIEDCIRFEIFDTFNKFMEQNFIRFL